jgi:hypothetical protein
MDLGSGIEKSRIRDKHPGSATLIGTFDFSLFFTFGEYRTVPSFDRYILFLNCWWRHATLFDLFVFIVQYEDMSRRIHCLLYIVWLVDVDWMHLEVGLK